MLLMKKCSLSQPKKDLLDLRGVPKENFLILLKAIEECPQTAEQLELKSAHERALRKARN